MGTTAMAQGFGGVATQGAGAGSGAVVAGGMGSGPLPTRATVYGALTLFAAALPGGDLARLEPCFVGTAEASTFLRLWENPTNDVERALQQVLKSVGTLIEVVQTTATEDGLKVKWKATVRRPFTTTEDGAAKTWQPGDSYLLELRLKQVGGEWKIVGF